MTRTLQLREKRRERFQEMMAEAELSRAKVAELLHVSIDTVNAWLKPESSRSSNPVPIWALELLGYKIADQDGNLTWSETMDHEEEEEATV